MTEIFAEDVIIGSGPNGWAAAMGVWSRGGRPLVIDIGYTQTNHGEESVIRNPMVQPKSLFGSKHMYSYPLEELAVQLPNATVPLSGALGGLSTVWGAGIQPVSERDLYGTPSDVGSNWMAASHRLLQNMSVLGRHDELSVRDPWPVNPHDEVVLSPRFQKILSRADTAERKYDVGVCFGSPRLAIVGSNQTGLENLCILCGKCMSGCPENSIFDAGRQIKLDISNRGGQYLNGIVERIGVASSDHASDRREIVEVSVILPTGVRHRVHANRVFLAAGAIGTPLLLQKSGLAPQKLVVQDSQLFYAAFISQYRYQTTELFMATSQGYFSTDLNTNSRDEFSLSVYEYSHDFDARLQQIVPTIFRPIYPAIAPLIKYILPGIGFLAPEVSGSIVVEYQKSKTIISCRINTDTEFAIKNAERRLRKASRRLGLLLLPNPFTQPTVGSGFHAGSSMPMGDTNGSLVDWSGSLKTLRGLKVVDTTSLPRIKAGSHTFMAMANAFRIASQVEQA